MVTGEKYNLLLIWPMLDKANDQPLRKVTAMTRSNSAIYAANCKAITNVSQSKSLPESLNQIKNRQR
jgi:hypothetical protein